MVAWLPIFTHQACRDILVRSFAYCRAHKGLRIDAWVLLDNHFHAIVGRPELAGAIADLKNYTRGLVLLVAA